MAHELPVVYEIDATDSLVFVNPAWSSVAEAVNAPGLREPYVVGKSLWEFVADPTTRQFYLAMLERARSRPEPIAFFFRCDTPTRRRLMSMDIIGLPKGAVRFEVRPVAVQDRPAVALLEPTAPRGTRIVKMCGWCKRLPLPGGDWVEVEEAVKQLDILDKVPLPVISHGMCPACYETIMRAMESNGPPDAPGPTLGALPPD